MAALSGYHHNNSIDLHNDNSDFNSIHTIRSFLTPKELPATQTAKSSFPRFIRIGINISSTIYSVCKSILVPFCLPIAKLLHSRKLILITQLNEIYCQSEIINQLFRQKDKNLLVPSVNAIRMENIEMCLKPPAKMETLNEFIENKNIGLKDGPLNLPINVCFGSSLWFIKEYLHHIKNQKNDPKTLISHLGNKFTRGAPKQATFIQYLYAKCFFVTSNNQKWLEENSKFKICLNETRSRKKKIELITREMMIDFFIEKILKLKITKKKFLGWQSTKANLQTINDLSPGVYFIKVPKHAMAYIKLNEDEEIIFDINDGVIGALKSDHQKNILSHCDEYNANTISPEERHIHIFKLETAD